MSVFAWLPILNELNGKKAMFGVFGFILTKVWIESYDGMIYAFTDEFQKRHEISLKEAKTIFKAQKEVYQPNLFQ